MGYSVEVIWKSQKKLNLLKSQYVNTIFFTAKFDRPYQFTRSIQLIFYDESKRYAYVKFMFKKPYLSRYDKLYIFEGNCLIAVAQVISFVE